MVGRGLALSLAMLLSPLATLAQEGPSPASPAAEMLPEIVVRAPREAQLNSFVGEVLSRTHGKQLARWHRPLCPSLRGFTAAQAALFEARLREVAALVRLPSTKAGCKPNVIVLLTDDPDRLVEEMLRDYPKIFVPALTASVREDLLTGGVARFWSVAVTNGAQGTHPDAMAVSGGATTTMVRAAPGNVSRLTSGARADMFRAMVILDVKGLRGLPLHAVADYTAMRLLGQIGEASQSELPSILGLFRPGDGPRALALTDWDRALLRELYTAPVGAAADSQRRQIVRRLAGTAAAPP